MNLHIAIKKSLSCTSSLILKYPTIHRSFRFVHNSSKFLEDQKRFYEENGYILIKNNVDHGLLDECYQRFINICDGKAGDFACTIAKDPVLKSKGAAGQYSVNKLQDYLYDDVLWKYASNKDVLDVVANIIGPNITAVHSMLINKPPDSNPDVSRHPIHQDMHYFPFRPAEKIVASWTAMQRVDENNGCLFVVPGSHNSPLYPHGYPEGTTHKLYHGVQGMDHLQKKFVVMEKGDTVFFHPLILHGSGPNYTKGFRKAISCHYADTNCHFIDVHNTSQGDIAKEIEEMAARRAGMPVNFVTVWKMKSRLVRGPPGNFQELDSHL